jgi:hypothetical protein
MTFFAYTECDGCGRKHDGELTPEGWGMGDGGDYCPECLKAKKASQRQGLEQEKK